MTVLACAPVLEVAEARAAEIRRALAKMAHAMDDAGDGVGEHFEFVDGVDEGFASADGPRAPTSKVSKSSKVSRAPTRGRRTTRTPTPRGTLDARAGTPSPARARSNSPSPPRFPTPRGIAPPSPPHFRMNTTPAVRGAHEKDPAREYGERHRALAAAREAVCFEAFAEAFRDAHLVAAQNGGARFDDATTRATKAERVLAAWLRVGGKREERDGVWRAWADARAELEGAELEGAEEGSRRATRLDELRSRRQGIRTAMAITRVTLRSGAVLTRVAQRPTAGR